jgi:hypothetical protein
VPEHIVPNIPKELRYFQESAPIANKLKVAPFIDNRGRLRKPTNPPKPIKKPTSRKREKGIREYLRSSTGAGNIEKVFHVRSLQSVLKHGSHHPCSRKFSRLSLDL